MNSITNQYPHILKVFSSCHQGASHIRMGSVCQDAAFASYKPKGGYAVAIVSDGHGSRNYFRSDKGAKIAVGVARKAIDSFMSHFIGNQEQVNSLYKSPETYLLQLERNIVYRWRETIREDYLVMPYSDKELKLMSDSVRKKYEVNPEMYFHKAYGATLIAVVVFPDKFWFGLHIGDGKCVARKQDGTFFQPIPWDDRCFLNTTTSLCDYRASDNFRHCFHYLKDSFPSAIFVGSDGIDDSFSNEEGLYGFYQEVYKTFLDKEFRNAAREVDEFLPFLSEKGSGDDVSLGGILLR